jgi:molybdopterin synthase catalytic subunit
MARISIRIQEADFEVSSEIARLVEGLPDTGAVVTFSGLCRSEDGSLAALELEHYPGMAEAEITRIAENAAARWPVTALAAIHRIGRIAPGGNIVLVIAASEHRHAAFDAASFLMDFLKSRAPFWKKEHHADGSQGGWVDAKESDSDSLLKWDVVER